MYLRFPIQL